MSEIFANRCNDESEIKPKNKTQHRQTRNIKETFIRTLEMYQFLFPCLWFEHSVYHRIMDNGYRLLKDLINKNDFKRASFLNEMEKTRNFLLGLRKDYVTLLASVLFAKRRLILFHKKGKENHIDNGNFLDRLSYK